MTKLLPPETPFPRHWLYYIMVKIVVLAVALLFALYLSGLFEVKL